MTLVTVSDEIDCEEAKSILSENEIVYFNDSQDFDGSVAGPRNGKDPVEVSSDDAVDYLEYLEGMDDGSDVEEPPGVFPIAPFDDLNSIRVEFSIEYGLDNESFLNCDVSIEGVREDYRNTPVIMEFYSHREPIKPEEAIDRIEQYIELPFI